VPDRLRVAIIGDRGIPARYSGFSTLVEEISARMVALYDMDVTVYCRSQYFDTHPPEWRGVRLVYLAAPGGKSFESLSHSARAILHAAVRPFDIAIVLDPGNSPLVLPLLARRIPFVIHTDGLGWQRRKWSTLQRRYYKWSEWVSAKLATHLVCDAPAMQKYYVDEYGAASAFIPYGGEAGDPPDDGAPARFGLEPGKYHLVVARLEPENNVDLIIREHKASKARLPLVYVGGARYESEYSRGIFAEADARVKCLGPVYETALLNGLYKHCRSYIHGHEVGGTNPSLLRAMAAGAACVPVDVIFHREVLGGDGVFFTKDAGTLGAIVERLEADDALTARLGRHALSRAENFYRWDAVAAGYAELLKRIVAARAEGKSGSRIDADVYHPERFVGTSRP
jgi:glycosyltransferase involved in cell wall biosynthesis